MDAIDYSPAPETPTEQADIAGSIGSEYVSYKPLYENFGINERAADSRVKGNLSTIWTWAREQAGVPDTSAVLWQITKLSRNLGYPSTGSARYSNVLSYISEHNRLVEQENRLHELRVKNIRPK